MANSDGVLVKNEWPTFRGSPGGTPDPLPTPPGPHSAQAVWGIIATSEKQINLMPDVSNLKGPDPTNEMGSVKHMHYWKACEILAKTQTYTKE